MTDSIAVALAMALIFTAILLHDQYRRNTELVEALTDAAMRCPKCSGEGRLATPGAWMSCYHCQHWRKVLGRNR